MCIEISAVICTHNRAQYLRKALASLCTQTLEKDRYEILVVDNASTDETATVVQHEYAEAANLRYLFEPELGLSVARNAGARLAKAPYIAYLDDDAIADSQWLENSLSVFHLPGLNVGIIGGPIRPIWESPRPTWLPDHLLPSLTILDPQRPAGVIDDTQRIYGANLLVSRRAFDAAGGFNANLGRKGSSLMSSEETALRSLIVAAGFVAYFDPAVIVHHHVPSQRLQRGWFYRRAYWQGRSQAVVFSAGSPGTVQRLLKAGQTVNSLLRLAISILLGVFRPNRTASWFFGKKCGIWRQLGLLKGLL